MAKIQTHKDLNVWQMSMDFVTKIYEISKKFPQEEMYGLTSQMRRSAVSIPSNISEGYGRYSDKECIRFLYISIASLSELDTQLIISYNLGYIDKETRDLLDATSSSIFKMLSALILSIKRKPKNITNNE